MGSASGSYALIKHVAGLDGLWLVAKRLTFVLPVETGAILPAADYDLLIRTGHEALQLTIGMNSVSIATYRLAPDTLNRVGPVRLGAGDISLSAVAVPSVGLTTSNEGYLPQSATTATGSAETVNRKGDYNTDHNTDYNQ